MNWIHMALLGAVAAVGLAMYGFSSTRGTGPTRHFPWPRQITSWATISTTTTIS